MKATTGLRVRKRTDNGVEGVKNARFYPDYRKATKIRASRFGSRETWNVSGEEKGPMICDIVLKK